MMGVSHHFLLDIMYSQSSFMTEILPIRLIIQQAGFAGQGGGRDR